MYELVIDRYAEKQLAKIPPPHFNRIVKSIRELSINPRPYGYKKLTGRDGYRIRSGNYRIIYTVQDNILTVFVIDIGHRKDIYD
jgi:mRNA interferase RelE/StbE